MGRTHKTAKARQEGKPQLVKHNTTPKNYTVTRLPKKPRFTLDRFNGDVPWKGTTQQVLGVGQTGETLTYGELTSRLDRRYGPGEQAKTFLTQLRAAIEKRMKELGQAIPRLTELAYPALPRESRERLARGHFLDVISNAEIRARVFRAHPKTLDEAIRAALETEAFLKSEQHRQGIRPDRGQRNTRHVGVVSRDEFARQSK